MFSNLVFSLVFNVFMKQSKFKTQNNNNNNNNNIDSLNHVIITIIIIIILGFKLTLFHKNIEHLKIHFRKKFGEYLVNFITHTHTHTHAHARTHMYI